MIFCVLQKEIHVLNDLQTLHSLNIYLLHAIFFKKIVIAGNMHLSR